MSTTIKFQDVSKKYKLYSKSGLYLRDRITHTLQRFNPLNGVSSLTSHPTPDPRPPLEKDFWALKNVSFEIKQGESVGFIGRNGAGKSTILKLLANVTKPSSGNVEIKGRVAALIEVGAGFHPELTGRENIFLNGSILGMRKAEIEKQFDNIVSFAELEQFIDTPVKHYSSGMYVRLGFAIAVHTHPDIFLIDEVLAVGDASFQAKCLESLAGHKASGKTMVLVSHDLSKIQEVCDRCVYVSQGEIRFDGTPSRSIAHYKKDIVSQKLPTSSSSEGVFSAKAEILDVLFTDKDDVSKSLFQTGDEIFVRIEFYANLRIANPVFGIGVYGTNGEHITGFNTRTSSFCVDAIEGKGSIYCRMRNFNLRSGLYRVSVSLHDFDYRETYDCHDFRYSFELECKQKHSSGLLLMHGDWALDHMVFRNA
jgi:ABC-type polysaccharide/polyol phosphate transport system ATPase subunit